VTGAPILLSVRLLDDDGTPWPGKVNIQFAVRSGDSHRLTIAPGATDTDLGGALRTIIGRELAMRDVYRGGQTPDERRAGMRVVDP